MNTAKNLHVQVKNLEDTKKLAHSLAKNLKGGETIELNSDLGGGKTTFTSYLVDALASEDQVSSPSFTLQNVYRLKNGEVHHYDFYRLRDAGVVGDELYESVSADDVITIIEWAGIVQDVLPGDCLRITISNLGASAREFAFSAPDTMTYILKDLNS